MMKSRSIHLFLLFALVILCTSVAQADPLKLLLATSGGPGVVVTDNLAGDLNPAVGVILYTPSLTGFTVSVTTGLSQPVIGGTNNYAEMDLNSIQVKASGAGSLFLLLADKNFSQGPNGELSLDGLVGGTLTAPAGSTASFQSWANPTNTIPDLASLTFPTSLSNVAPAGSVAAWTGGPVTFGPGAFSSTSSSGFIKAGDYSLFSGALINFTGAGTLSFDLNTQVTPEPTSLLLLGSGLAGIGLLARRKKSAVKSMQV